MALNREKLDKARPRIEGLLCGLGIVALAAVFFLVLLPGAARVASNRAPEPLRGWSNARIMAELGEYDSKIDCAQLGLQGLDGYVWVKLNLAGQPTRFLFICK